MLRTVLLLVLFLGIQFCKAQDFLWATQIGGKSQDFGREIIKTPSGYILPIQFSDSFYALGKWHNSNKNNLFKRSLFLCFYSFKGILYKVIRPEHGDSIQIGRFNNELTGDRISFNAISILPNTFINGKYHDPQKYNLLFELDTNGKFHEILRVSCIKKGTYVNPSLVYFGSTNSLNNSFITISLIDTNCTYYINDDSIVLNDSGKIALIRINKLTLKLNWTLFYNNFTPSRLVPFGSGFMMCCSFNDTSGVFEFKGEQYQISKTNRIFILTLDNLLAMDTVYFIKGNLSMTMYNRFSVNSANGFSFIPFNVAEYNDTLVFEGRKIPVDYAAFCYINYFSNGKIRHSKLITKQGSEIWNTDGSFSNYTIESKGQFNYLSGSTYLPLKVYPDSLLINCKIRDPDFFLMKLDTFGNILWYLNFGKKGSSEYANPVIIEDDGVVVSGTFDSTTTLGNYTLTSNGGTDALLFKITDNSIYRGDINKGPYCAGDSMLVPYRAYGKYADTNTFFAELSDENGNFFGKPRLIGQLKSNAAEGVIRGALPLFDVETSGKYRIRIRSNSPFVQSFMRYDSLYLLIYSRDKANPGPDTTICRGSALNIKTTGGSLWHWSPGTAVVDSTARRTVFISDKSTRLRIAIADSSGCGEPDTAWLNITVRPGPVMLNTDTTVCASQPFYLKGKATQPGPDSTKITWVVNGTLQETDSIQLIADTTLAIQVFGTNACGAGEGKNINIYVFSKPSSNLLIDSTCAITSHKLNYSGSGGKKPLKWFVNGAESIAPKTMSAMPQQMVISYVQDACAIKSKPDTALLYGQPRSMPIVDNTSGCAPLNVVLQNRTKTVYTGTVNDGQGNTRSWQPDTMQFLYAKPGIYKGYMLLENGICRDSNVFNVQVFNPPTAGFVIQRSELLEGEASTRITNFSTGGTQYIWSWSNAIKGVPADPAFDIIVEDTGNFIICLTTTDGNNCSDTVCKEIRVHPKPRMWFATGLSMNNDGLNEQFYPVGVGIKTYRLMVFNRWGEMVYKGDENRPWQPDERILPGLYAWRCIYTNWQGTAFETQGTVLVIR